MEEDLREKLFDKKENGWKKINEEERKKAFEISKGYMEFLNKSKIEREFIKNARKLADQNGFRDIMEFDTLKPGDKIYFINRNKSMYLAIIGSENIENGMHIIGSHVEIQSPATTLSLSYPRMQAPLSFPLEMHTDVPCICVPQSLPRKINPSSARTHAPQEHVQAARSSAVPIQTHAASPVARKALPGCPS